MNGEQVETKERAKPLQIGGSFKKQRNLHLRLVLGGYKRRRLQPPTRILGFYRDHKGIQSLISVFHPYSPNNILLSQGYVLYEASGAGIMHRMYIPKMRGEE